MFFTYYAHCPRHVGGIITMTKMIISIVIIIIKHEDDLYQSPGHKDSPENNSHWNNLTRSQNLKFITVISLKIIITIIKNPPEIIIKKPMWNHHHNHHPQTLGVSGETGGYKWLSHKYWFEHLLNLSLQLYYPNLTLSPTVQPNKT